MCPPTKPNSVSSAAEGAAAGHSIARCPHCGTPVEGQEDVFCCSGCEMAAAIIKGAGLEAYYQERDAFPPRPEGVSGDWDAIPVTTDENGLCEIRLQVDGLRCASCVWVTENVLQRTEGVAEATLSYATGRASVKWDPEKEIFPGDDEANSLLDRPRRKGWELPELS